ncbi:phosphatase PAP2 family protein [Paenibacillus sp. ACRRX]|uniref:phosphatase PAP2 family protein n=1 Tax=Paenibacillus sp. ACRRX TaxID=2918206 RepID=UPI001EF53C08|nr:phosphatase PAP2 family protein [Paenibacillus sp. ACRRX]MCG7409743.1 phosphatase PAP2 family protein [Paenibacillus sp. ACRRX]
MTKSTSMKSRAVNYTVSLIWGLVLVPPLLLGLGWITKGVMSNDFNRVDTAVTDFLRQWSSPLITKIVIFFTHFASSHIIIPLAILLALWFAFRKRLYMHAITLLIALTGSYLLNEGMKAWLQRARPEWEHWVAATGYSFPSGHAMVSTAFYGMLTYIIVRICRAEGKPSTYIWVAGVLLIVVIGLSRVYLGVHYITDVSAGFIAGGIWLIACMYALGWMTREK